MIITYLENVHDIFENVRNINVIKFNEEKRKNVQLIFEKSLLTKVIFMSHERERT